MRNKKIKITLVVVVIAAVSIFFMLRMRGAQSTNEITKEINPFIGSIQTFISTTGTVLPKNRLEVKPPVNGRVESIDVEEGQKVKAGQTLAWMSSTERAALLDAASGQGEAAQKYWKDTYKAIPLLSPIDGEVIVATTQPGQTVTTADAIVVLSDHLIVRAQVDETDIGKISLGQEALITLDAYQDTKIKAQVEHIYYESKTVNNVTVYAVDLLPVNIPLFFRSGMNATIDLKAAGKDNTLLIPAEAVHKEQGETFVLVKQEGKKDPVKCRVKLGITDDKNVEIISGINAEDKVIVKTRKYTFPNSKTGTNPFMPARPQQRAKSSG